jgi:hypothetical protein
MVMKMALGAFQIREIPTSRIEITDEVFGLRDENPSEAGEKSSDDKK